MKLIRKTEIEEIAAVNLEPDTSVFWIGYDGDWIDIILNQPYFSTYENTIKTFPDFVTPRQVEIVYCKKIIMKWNKSLPFSTDLFPTILAELQYFN